LPIFSHTRALLILLSILMYLGIYSHTFVYERKDDCAVCTSTVHKLTLTRFQTLNELIQQLRDGDLRLTAPSLTTTHKTLYMSKPPALERATRPNLDMPVSSLISSGEEVTVTDPVLQNIGLGLSITFTD